MSLYRVVNRREEKRVSDDNTFVLFVFGFCLCTLQKAWFGIDMVVLCFFRHIIGKLLTISDAANLPFYLFFTTLLLHSKKKR